MLVSLNEIKKLVKIPAEVSTEELVKLIGSRLVEVEGTIDLSKKYKGIKIVEVVSCEAIPETHLHLCQINAGEKDLVQVVCGAPNVRKGMLAVWLRPGCIVPQTYGGENFELGVRKMRGHESNGMLAGLDEIDLGDDHSGIVEIDPKFAKAGDDFAEKFGLNDIILDIENKSLTHRPDTFGLIGFAREVAGILGIKFKEPTVKFGNLDITTTLSADELSENVSDAEKVWVEVEDTKLCPRYTAGVFEVSGAGLKNALEINEYLTLDDVFLAKAGMRKISKIVDATNITMLLTGQPLHAFDYDKFVKVGGLDEPKIVVRAAKKGEKLKLLDRKEIELVEKDDIVICSNETPVALAGAMGGEETEIDENTKKVILESATFSLIHERKMQMAHGIFSEAITRFTKGQPEAGTVPALARCAAMLLKTPKDIVDFEVSETFAEDDISVELYLKDINDLLGTKYTALEVTETLENVGFKVMSGEDDLIKVIAPNWRTDIHIKEDIIEEVGRLRGYDNIPMNLPLRPFIGADRNKLFDLKREIRGILSDRIGANEVLTYSFVSKDLQEKVGEDFSESYEIVNSISPELQVFRQSIIPSLIDKMYENIRSGYKDFTLYEFNQVTSKKLGLTEEKVPEIENHLALISTGDFYDAKNKLEELGKRLNLEFKLEENNVKEFPYFERVRSAKVMLSGETIGVVGEIKQRVLRGFKVKEAAGFEINLDEVVDVPRNIVKDLKLSKFPFVERDLTLKVKAEMEYGALEKAILEALGKEEKLVYKLAPVSIYQGIDKSSKNISFHISFSNTEKTLESSEISDIMKSIEKKTSGLGALTV
ncbi:phenylalanine--tRNA ligase subunit beta [Candidatus Saccharibacteria bacterium]|nr:phenylalanine--tRNA ligase subunit beta [Candidatus Saccharibacteria bacterium]